MSGQTVLITGGSGFLGARTARRILRQIPGQKIVLTDLVPHPRAAMPARWFASRSAGIG